MNASEQTPELQVDARHASRPQVLVFNSPSELARFASEWDSFVADSTSDIYFTFDWLNIWWQYYGDDREFCAIMVKVDGRIVAALPFVIQAIGVRPLCIRLAKLAGADSTITVLFPPIEASLNVGLMMMVLKYLIEERGCDLVSFSPLSGRSSLTDELSALTGPDENELTLLRKDVLTVHTEFELARNFDIYFQSLSKQVRSNYRRDIRGLTSEGNKLLHHVELGTNCLPQYEAFVKLHERQWQATGRLGHFGDWPKSVEFNRDLVACLSAKGLVRFFELWRGSELLSSQYCFVLKSRCYWRLPARCIDPTLEKSGLGRVGLVKMIETLVGEGVGCIEAGPGHYDYKMKHGGRELPLYRIVLTRSSLAAKFRGRIVLAWSDMMHFIYYRLWFLKVSGKLGLRGRALSRSWIRSRV